MTRPAEWGLRSYQDKPDSTSWGGQNVFDVYTKSTARRSTGRIQGLVGRPPQGSWLVSALRFGTLGRRPSVRMENSMRTARTRTMVGRGERGFTLIELLVVISMISILAAMGVVQYRNSVQRTRETTLRYDLFQMRDVIDQYYADKGNTRRRWTRWSATATCARSRSIRSRTPPTPGRPFPLKPIRGIRHRSRGSTMSRAARPALRSRAPRSPSSSHSRPQSARQGLKTLAPQRGLKAPLYNRQDGPLVARGL